MAIGVIQDVANKRNRLRMIFSKSETLRPLFISRSMRCSWFLSETPSVQYSSKVLESHFSCFLFQQNEDAAGVIPRGMPIC